VTAQPLALHAIRIFHPFPAKIRNSHAPRYAARFRSFPSVFSLFPPSHRKGYDDSLFHARTIKSQFLNFAIILPVR
jgi:hypothetical protein